MILGDHGLRLAQQRVACLRVGCRVQLGHQSLKIRVVILEIVIRVGVDANIHRFGVTYDCHAEVLSLEHRFKPLGPLDIIDLGGDTNLGQLRGDDLSAAAGVGGGRQVQRGLEPVGKAGFGQQSFGFFDVMQAQRGLIDIGRVMGREMRTDGRAVSKHRTINNGLTINGMGDGGAHLGVIKRRLFVVHRQNGFALGRTDKHLKPRVRFELRQVLGCGEAGEDINIFGHHRRERGGRVRDEFERGDIQRGRGPPVVRVLLDADIVALGPAGEFERAGADGQLLDIVDAFGCHDHRVAPCEVEQQVAVRL